MATHGTPFSHGRVCVSACWRIMLVLFILFACEKDEPKVYNNFTIKLSDDVIPCVAYFDAKGDWTQTSWCLNDSLYSNKIDDNSGFMLLGNSGVKTISFSGQMYGDRYVGLSEFEAPTIAKHIMINGCRISSGFCDFEQNQVYDFSFVYFEGEKRFTKTYSFSLDDVSQNLLLFKQPIVFRINDFLSSDSHYNIAFGIKKQVTNNQKNVFSGSFYLKDRYLQNIENNDTVYVLNVLEDVDFISVALVVDWLP